MLHISHLDIGYNNRIVQTNLSLNASSGEMICMLGTNGCGKSTLLRTLAGLQPALGGSIHIGENRMDLNYMNATGRAKIISLVLTERLSVDNTSVHDIVAMGRYPYTSFLGGLHKADEDVISQSLHQTGLTQYKDTFFNCLSDGEKQRVLIAKALAQQTPIILLDEPTAHLDLPNRIKTLLLLRQMAHEKNKTIIISTHELDLALQMADTIWLMIPNSGMKTGSATELVQSGAFEHAFADDNFCFRSENNRLHIVLRY